MKAKKQKILLKMFSPQCCNSNLFKCKALSRVRLFVTPWAIQSMEFSRPEYWSG